MLSSKCRTLSVAGIAQVTAALPRIHLRRNCAHDLQSNSPAQSGSGLARTRAKRSPLAKGRLINTATPRSRANGKSRCVGRAVDDRVIDLEKVELLAAQNFLHFRKRGIDIVRDAEVTDAPLLFPGAHGRELGVDIDQIVDLHEIEPLHPQTFERPLHRVDPRLLSTRPDFGGEEKFFAQMQFTRQVADHAFGPAVHRRAIDHLSAELDKARQHFLERRAFVRRSADVEDLPGAETDNGDFFSRGRNGAGQHRGFFRRAQRD